MASAFQLGRLNCLLEHGAPPRTSDGSDSLDNQRVCVLKTTPQLSSRTR